jgi:hypothetical protein
LIISFFVSQRTYLSQHRISYRIQVNCSFIGQVIEHIKSPHSLWSLLFVAKNEINPLVKLAGNKFALQSLEKGVDHIIMNNSTSEIESYLEEAVKFNT